MKNTNEDPKRMNRINLLKSLLILSLIFVVSSCQQGVNLSEEELRETATVQTLMDLVDTAVFETEVVVMLTEIAPTATLTLTPSPTFTLTPLPSHTPMITETVFKNPWVMQDECITESPSRCIGYSVQNTNKVEWINVNLINQATGEEGIFSIAPKSTGKITLVPGKYTAIYSCSCAGIPRAVTKIWDLYARTDAFYCSTGLHELRLR